MKNRFLGALRDMWWLLALLAVASILMGAMVDWIISVVAIVLLLATFAYYAVWRYDDDGRERR